MIHLSKLLFTPELFYSKCTKLQKSTSARVSDMVEDISGAKRLEIKDVLVVSIAFLQLLR